MLRVSNDNIIDLAYGVGRCSIIISSYHPKGNEVDIVINAFLQKFKGFLQVGKTTLGDDPFLLKCPSSYAQIVNNVADYLGLEATLMDEDSFSIRKRK